MRYALKGQPNVNVPAPAGMVQKGRDYYLNEFQSTNPALPLDNRADGPVSGNGGDSDDDYQDDPSTPTPVQEGGQTTTTLDPLF